MTIQEAIKANETRRVRMVGADEWFDAKSMVICDTFTIEDIRAEWEAEPEKIEFECEWRTGTEDPIHPCSDDVSVTKILNHFIGKRTRVTVEVIDE